MLFINKKRCSPVNLCMGSHIAIKAKTFINVLVSKIEQKKYFSKNLSETIAKVSKVLGSAYVLSVC